MSLAVVACASLALVLFPPATRYGAPVSSTALRFRPVLACDAPPPADSAPSVPPTPAPIESYIDAEKRAFEYFTAGNYESSIRMFELAQTLPGEGIDYKRKDTRGISGSASAAPNPRGMVLDRFATPEQKMIAKYNIACCYVAMGDKPRSIEILREYLKQVGEPLNQVNEMMVDGDLASIRDELRVLREEFKGKKQPGLFGNPFGIKNPLRGIADEIGVEWKD